MDEFIAFALSTLSGVIVSLVTLWLAGCGRRALPLASVAHPLRTRPG